MTYLWVDAKVLTAREADAIEPAFLLFLVLGVRVLYPIVHEPFQFHEGLLDFWDRT